MCVEMIDSGGYTESGVCCTLSRQLTTTTGCESVNLHQRRNKFERKSARESERKKKSTTSDTHAHRQREWKGERNKFWHRKRNRETAIMKGSERERENENQNENKPIKYVEKSTSRTCDAKVISEFQNSNGFMVCAAANQMRCVNACTGPPSCGQLESKFDTHFFRLLFEQQKKKTNKTQT